MDQHRIDPDGLEKNNVAQQALDRFVAFHRTATVFYDKRLTAEFLQIGQRLDQRRRTDMGISQTHSYSLRLSSTYFSVRSVV